MSWREKIPPWFDDDLDQGKKQRNEWENIYTHNNDEQWRDDKPTVTRTQNDTHVKRRRAYLVHSRRPLHQEKKCIFSSFSRALHNPSRIEAKRIENEAISDRCEWERMRESERNYFEIIFLVFVISNCALLRRECRKKSSRIVVAVAVVNFEIPKFDSWSTAKQTRNVLNWFLIVCSWNFQCSCDRQRECRRMCRSRRKNRWAQRDNRRNGSRDRLSPCHRSM